MTQSPESKMWSLSVGCVVLCVHAVVLVQVVEGFQRLDLSGNDWTASQDHGGECSSVELHCGCTQIYIIIYFYIVILVLYTII